MEVPPLEKTLGLELYSTDFPGVGGRLKQQLEDFCVEEVSTDGEVLQVQQVSHANQTAEPTRLSIAGKPERFVRFTMQKIGLSTMDVSSIIAAQLKLPRQMVGYAGLKDKRAITTQLMSVPKSVCEDLTGISLSRIELRNLHYSRHSVEIGDLWGNQFNILVRDIEEDCKKAVSFIDTLKGTTLLNYFGVQRFGVTRPVTHIIGRSLVRGDYEDALRIMLTTSSEFESTMLQNAREELKEDLRPTERTLELFPEALRYERKALKSLINQPGNYPRAISMIPQKMQTLFVHSYQSYLFNRLISLRKREGLPLDIPVPGDFLIELDQPHSGRDSWLFVTERNHEERCEQVLSGGFGLAAPLPGYSTKTPPGVMSDHLRQILQEEDMDLLSFRNPENRYLNSAGSLHLISIQPHEMHGECTPNGPRLRFKLRKGSYATVVLREVMKNHPINRV